MNAREKNIAIVRGEALAAHLSASVAIRAALAITSKPRRGPRPDVCVH